ncbi:hypothetical protein F5884DRAFT_851029 [Xylogone sp. PMI_703]|nr:hypothetical protein F5884DRAFT_851029 [Xylogone sp. PMI_703]
MEFNNQEQVAYPQPHNDQAPQAPFNVRDWVILVDINYTPASPITTMDQFYNTLQELLPANKRNRDYDKSLPRQVRINALIDELLDGDTMPPLGYNGQKATWKHEVKKLYTTISAVNEFGITYYTLYRRQTPKELQEEKPLIQITPAEHSYAIIANSHLDNNGHHLGRDATFARVCQYSASITKEIVTGFLKTCPGCNERTKAAQVAYRKRSPEVLGGRVQKRKNSKGKGVERAGAVSLEELTKDVEQELEQDLERQLEAALMEELNRASSGESAATPEEQPVVENNAGEAAGLVGQEYPWVVMPEAAKDEIGFNFGEKVAQPQEFIDPRLLGSGMDMFMGYQGQADANSLFGELINY